MKVRATVALVVALLCLSCRKVDTSSRTYHAAEQGVVRTLLSAEFVDTARHAAPPEIVLCDHFDSQDSVSVEGALAWLRDSVPNLPRSAAERFRQIQGDSTAIAPFGMPRVSVHLLADSTRKRIFAKFPRDTLGWATFRREHPRASGIVSISRVAISDDGTWALIYAGRRSDYLAGGGYLYALRKDGEAWRIIDRTMLWVS